MARFARFMLKGAWIFSENLVLCLTRRGLRNTLTDLMGRGICCRALLTFILFEVNT